MKTWRVKFQDVNLRQARYPFWKKSVNADAATRAEAIAKVKAFFGRGAYDKWSASPTSEKADYQFEERPRIDYEALSGKE